MCGYYNSVTLSRISFHPVELLANLVILVVLYSFLQHIDIPMVMTINTIKIENLVSSIEGIRKIIQKRNGVVSGAFFSEFIECLQGLELNFVIQLVSTLECAVEGLFEEVYKAIHRNNFTVTDQNLMYILVLLIVHKTSKAFAPRTINHWIIVHVCMIYLKNARKILIL